jgi:hypothetical protein
MSERRVLMNAVAIRHLMIKKSAMILKGLMNYMLTMIVYHVVCVLKSWPLSYEPACSLF